MNLQSKQSVFRSRGNPVTHQDSIRRGRTVDQEEELMRLELRHALTDKKRENYSTFTAEILARKL